MSTEKTKPRKGKRTNAEWAANPMVRQARLAAVNYLRRRGFACKEIAVAMRITPDYVRRLEAKAARITNCTCPATYDHSPYGHLPFCPHDSL